MRKFKQFSVKMKLLTLLLFGNVFVVALCDSDLLVKAPAGAFMGHTLKTRAQRDILAFEGIPYAMPPLGPLRFMDPVKMPMLDGTYNATNGFKDCFQPPLNFKQFANLSAYSGTEDCLYLNVYKPKAPAIASPLPVLVWIHGGGYILGSGSSFWNGPEFLLDKDMILVTINYRLGVLGFLFDDNKGIAGNFGMKDQSMALKWVKENILAFGGEPSQVTIAGESAGGAAVSLHMHSPLSKDSFQKAIAQSGTIHSPFALEPAEIASRNARKVAEDLGCSEDKDKLLKCLQKMPIQELVKSGLTLTPDEEVVSVDFIPVLEKPSPSAFITEESMKRPSEHPLVVGVTSHEALHFIDELTSPSKKYNGDKAKINEDLDSLMPIWGRYMYHPKKQEITDALVKFYFGENGKLMATESQMIDYLSDIQFNHAAYKAAATEMGPTFMYKFSYKGNLIPSVPSPKGLEDGVGHGEDLFFLFQTGYRKPANSSKEDQTMSETLVDLWYNFVKTGSPTPGNVWEESNKGVKYLDITNKGLEMKSNMFQERMNMLQTLNLDRFSEIV